jgi:hypothetical protein
LWEVPVKPSGYCGRGGLRPLFDLAEQRRAGSGGTFQHHHRPYTEIMEKSPFSKVEEHKVPVRRKWTADAVMGYLYSTSFASPALFGDRPKEFYAAARAVLAKHSDDGQFTEDNEFLIRISRTDARHDMRLRELHSTPDCCQADQRADPVPPRRLNRAARAAPARHRLDHRRAPRRSHRRVRRQVWLLPGGSRLCGESSPIVDVLPGCSPPVTRRPAGR